MDDKVSILIVDDDAGMCETLFDIMEDKGYRTVIALDGYEAIQKVKEMDFDVILMDIKMPGMDGVETFKEIKKIHPETAVVMMTAYAVEDLIKEALHEGAYDVLYKPLDIERMIGLIEDVRAGGSYWWLTMTPISARPSKTYWGPEVTRSLSLGVARKRSR